MCVLVLVCAHLHMCYACTILSANIRVCQYAYFWVCGCIYFLSKWSRAFAKSLDLWCLCRVLDALTIAKQTSERPELETHFGVCCFSVTSAFACMLHVCACAHILSLIKHRHNRVFAVAGRVAGLVVSRTRPCICSVACGAVALHACHRWGFSVSHYVNRACT